MECIHSPGLMEEICVDTVSKRQEIHQYKTINSPVGPLTLIADSKALLNLGWGEELSNGEDNLQAVTERCDNSIIDRTEEQLIEYFDGKRFVFDIPLDPRGTNFQKQVWQQLLKIPYGQHISYGEQARRLGRPKSARAVGAANGKNPIGIIIPCHRVLGASGALTGFAGGLDIKRHLLALEGVRVMD